MSDGSTARPRAQRESTIDPARSGDGVEATARGVHTLTPAELKSVIAAFVRDEQQLREAVGGVVVGQGDARDLAVAVLLAGGHALVEGVPGTGKTLLVRAISQAAGLDFGRVQFTPDLLPADILGCDTLVLDAVPSALDSSHGGASSTADDPRAAGRVEFAPGPIFTQFLLADEINRGTPRTQSALLEAMQEGAVTAGGTRHALDPLFTVFATRNPIEMEGTYPLPEAQLDRFLVEIEIPDPPADRMADIALRTTGGEESRVRPVLDAARLARMRAEVRNVVAARDVVADAATWIAATRPESPEAGPLVRECVRYGAGVRALQALVLLGKVEALRAGRAHVCREDLRSHLAATLRHRIILSLDGESRGVTIAEIVEEVRRRRRG